MKMNDFEKFLGFVFGLGFVIFTIVIFLLRLAGVAVPDSLALLALICGLMALAAWLQWRQEKRRLGGGGEVVTVGGAVVTDETGHRYKIWTEKT